MNVEDIDRSWMAVFHTPIGPFGIIDSIGLETVWKVNDFWAERLKNGQARKNADFLRGYIDQGRLGVKSGKGFYEYPHPQYRQADFTRRKKP